MSLADQVTNLTNDRNNIRTSLINKGITEAASHGFSSFDDDIDRMVKPEGTITVTENGTYDVTEREGIVVDVYTVEPIDSPNASINSQVLSPILYITWTTVEDSICYTLQRRTTSTDWTTLCTLYTQTSYIDGTDSPLIEEETYYYRVFAICDGTGSYGNSLSSNVVSAVAHEKSAHSILFYDLYDYCEESSGGWVVEGCDRNAETAATIDPYTPEIETSTFPGCIKFDPNFSGHTSKSVWMHTVTPVTIDVPEGQLCSTVAIRLRTTYAPIYIGAFPVDKNAQHIVIRKTTNTANMTTFVFDITTPGQYYFGVQQEHSSSTGSYVFVEKVMMTNRIWDGYIFNKSVENSDITSITGGYKLEDSPKYNPSGYVATPFTLTREDVEGEDGYCIVLSGNETGNTYGGIITTNQVPFYGCTKIEFDAENYKSNPSQYIYFSYFDKDYNRIGGNGVSRSSMDGRYSGSIDFSTSFDAESIYYVEISVRNMKTFKLYSLSFS